MKDINKLREYQKEWYQKQKENNLPHLKERQQKNNKQKDERARQKKVKYILLKGGVCTSCRYKYDGTNAAAFDFHHINSNEKEYSPAQILKYSEEKIQNELNKCILVCANCHRLIHSKKF